MRLKMFQADAFSAATLSGNPAAVVPLEEWLADETMLAIAAENNQAETAFFVCEKKDTYRLRWFTPEVEVDLCGHATLAAAWILFEELNATGPVLTFETRGGALRVTRNGDMLTMDFPLTHAKPVPSPAKLLSALGIQNAEVFQARDYVVVVDDATQVAALSPDFAALKECTTFGVSVTAPSTEVDFVSRWFGPAVGVDEDITTGSAHTWLAAYWTERLGKQTVTAIQGGRRQGRLSCEVVGDRVHLTGRAATYLEGMITI